MTSTATHTISLTGPGSHTLRVPPGVGNLYIGPRRMPAYFPQVQVDPDQPLDWSALDVLPPVPAGYLWPRYLYYEGNDLGLFRWAERRRIEVLDWTPTQVLAVDASAAAIRTLRVTLGEAEITLTLPAQVSLTVRGRAAALRPRAAGGGAGVHLEFSDLAFGHAPPFYPEFEDLAWLEIASRNAPSDGRWIARYARLTHLGVRGPLESAAPFAALRGLRTIELRQVWNLSDLPPLCTWPQLQRLLAVDIPREVGRRLLAEAKGIAGLDAAIRGLRAPDWIERNAHSPFRTWAASPRAAAQAAFSEAGARLRGCAGVDQVRQVIEAFVHALNAAHARHALETSEREDAAGAVDLLVREAGYQDLRADAQGWFDAVRSF